MTSQPVQTTCRTVILADDPASADLLGGAHASVASAVLRICLHSEGGRVIGLEGGWGSGKSTVLSLLQADAAGTPDLLFVNFDTWSHESDPLRRVFLERLIDGLVQARWVDSESWHRRKSELSGRIRKSKVEKRSKLTGFGKRLAFAIALAPAGLALLQHDWRYNDVRLWCAWALALAPVFVMVLNWLMARRAPTADDSDIWDITLQNQRVEEQTETLETPEPTSVEFERAFVELVTEALKNRKRRLVICLDNLDRVATDAALSLWSTLQAFTQFSRAPGADWAGRTWFIVSYDPTALRRLWEPGSPNVADSLGEAFIRKTFAVRLAVPPALLADWRKYLNERLRLAMPDHPEADFYGVSRVFATFRTDPDAPTPRELNQFVSQLALLHDARQHEFPLVDAAYFVLLRQKGVDVADALLKREVPSQQVRSFLGQGVDDSLVALTFGTTVEAARQHLLREPLEKALREGDDVAISSRVGVPGFWQVLEQIEASTWLRTEGRSIALAASALGRAGILDSEQAEARSIRTRMAESCQSVSGWGFLDKGVASGLVELIRSSKTVDLAKLEGSINATAKAVQPPARTPEWLEGIKVFLDGLGKAGAQLPSGTVFDIPGGAQEWMEGCDLLHRQSWPTETVRLVRPLAAMGDISGLVVRELIERSAPSALACAQVMAQCRSTYDSQAVRSGVIERLQNQTEIPVEVLEQCFQVLDAYDAEDPHAASAIVGLLAQGWLHHHLNSSWKSGSDDALVLLLDRILRDALPLATPPAVGNSSAGYEVLRQFLKAPSSRPSAVSKLSVRSSGHEWMSVWCERLDREPQLSPLLTAMVVELAGSGRLAANLRALDISLRWPFIRACLVADTQAQADLFHVHAADVVELLARKPMDRESLDLYLGVARALSGPGIASLATLLEQGASGLSREEWLGEFRNPGPWFQLIRALQEKGSALRLPIGFREAARAHAEELLVQGLTDAPLSAFWSTVESALGDDAKTVLRDWVFDDVASANKAPSEAFLSTYARLFVDEHFLSTERRIIQGLIRPIIESNHPASLRWIEKILRDHSALGDSAPRAHLQDLREKIASLKDGADSETLELLSSIEAQVSGRGA